MTPEDQELCCDLGRRMERVKAIPNREGVTFLVDLFLAVIEAEGLTVVEADKAPRESLARLQ